MLKIEDLVKELENSISLAKAQWEALYQEISQTAEWKEFCFQNGRNPAQAQFPRKKPVARNFAPTTSRKRLKDAKKKQQIQANIDKEFST